MPEWILKIVGEVKSTRSAFIILLFCLYLGVIWRDGYSYLIGRGIPDDFILYILVLMSVCVSYLSVEIFTKIFEIIQSKRRKTLEKNKQDNEHEIFVEKVEKSIPSFPNNQLSILISLLDSENTLEEKGGVNYLAEQGYIRRLHRVSRNSSVFEISSTVADILKKYLKRKRISLIRGFIESITPEEKEFLSVFFEQEIPFGVPESEIMMVPAIYKSGVEMVGRGVLSFNDEKFSDDSFQLPEDVSVALVSHVFDAPPVRHTVKLDPAYIISTYASGGGATGTYR